MKIRYFIKSDLDPYTPETDIIEFDDDVSEDLIEQAIKDEIWEQIDYWYEVEQQ